jgi:thiamine biosynthesis protein ThiS
MLNADVFSTRNIPTGRLTRSSLGEAKDGVIRKIGEAIPGTRRQGGSMSAQNMEICVNGGMVACPQGQALDLFLDAFLERSGLSPEGVVVEINGQILRPRDFANYILNAKDQVEIIHFVGGG